MQRKGATAPGSHGEEPGDVPDLGIEGPRVRVGRVRGLPAPAGEHLQIDTTRPVPASHPAPGPSTTTVGLIRPPPGQTLRACSDSTDSRRPAKPNR